MRTFHSKKTNKYPYAYDEHGNIIPIEVAITLSHRKWYLDPGLQIELNLLCNLPKQVDHWRTLFNQKININGVDYEYSHDKDSESFEHKQFKFNILKKQCINIKDYNVFLVNPKEEIRIIDSKFRADVMAELPCGTPCVIEIIKTSDISQRKHEFIEKNQILTFKIYIDENGNQITKRDNIIGVTEISELARRIQDAEGKLAELKEEISRERGEGENRSRKKAIEYTAIERDKSNKLTELRDRIAELEAEKRGTTESNKIKESDRATKLRGEIQQFEYTIGVYQKSILQQSWESEIPILEKSIREYQEKLRIETDIQARHYKPYINIIKGYQEEIDRLRNLEQKVLKIIEDCEPQWFGYQPKGVDKVNHILYHIS